MKCVCYAISQLQNKYFSSIDLNIIDQYYDENAYVDESETFLS